MVPLGLCGAFVLTWLGEWFCSTNVADTTLTVGGVFGAVPTAATFFVLADIEHAKGQFLGGLGEMIFAWLAVFATVAGAGLLLAGCSGPRLHGAGPVSSIDRPPT